jgi:hypothetical protein
VPGLVGIKRNGHHQLFRASHALQQMHLHGRHDILSASTPDSWPDEKLAGKLVGKAIDKREIIL